MEVVGGGLLLAGIGLLASDAGKPDDDDYDVDAEDYASYQAYDDARDQAQEHYDAALVGWRDERAFTSAFLAGVGAMFVVTAPFATGHAAARRADPHRVYDATRARELVDAAAAPPPPRITPAIGPGTVGLVGTF
jgi:hypothetical protein